MSRQVWVQDPQTGRLVPKDDWVSGGAQAHIVIPDIGDFQNPEGVWLNGRRALRNDLARKNCHVYERGERQYIDNMRAQDERDERKKLLRVVGDIAAERGLGVPD